MRNKSNVVLFLAMHHCNQMSQQVRWTTFVLWWQKKMFPYDKWRVSPLVKTSMPLGPHHSRWWQFKYFYFHPYLGRWYKWSNLTIIFSQTGWFNHHLVIKPEFCALVGIGWFPQLKSKVWGSSWPLESLYVTWHRRPWQFVSWFVPACSNYPCLWWNIRVI